MKLTILRSFKNLETQVRNDNKNCKIIHAPKHKNLLKL